ncbi:MAG: hypothetical protein ACUVX1_12890 [Chloroflexota bacterium]
MKVEILLPDITALITKTRFDDGGLVTTIQFNSKVHPGMLARILNLQRQGCPLLAAISSPQATMDLYTQDESAQAPVPEEEAQL